MRKARLFQICLKSYHTSSTLLTVSELLCVKIATENIKTTIFYKFFVKSGMIWSEMLVIILCLRVRPLSFCGFSKASVGTLSNNSN